MGGHAGFALGLALAQPNRKVVLFDSEGDILMSLGMLTTIAEQAPANFYHFLLTTRSTRRTGGQPVPNAKNVKYDRLALAAGYPRAQAFDKLDDLDRALPEILSRPGPVFVALKVYPRSRTRRSAAAAAGTPAAARKSSPICRASSGSPPNPPRAHRAPDFFRGRRHLDMRHPELR